MNFWTLELNPDGKPNTDIPAKGPFKSRQSAIDFIRNEVETDYCESNSSISEAKGFSSNYMILSEIERVYPNIIVDVRVELRKKPMEES